MNVRRATYTVGVVAGVVGVAFVVAPGLAVGVPATKFYVGFVGLFAVFAALVDAAGRRGVSFPRAETDDPEAGLGSLPRPGESFDEAFRRATVDASRTSDEQRAVVRERLRAVAIDAVAHRENCGPAEAADRLASGEWTDDIHAAAFFADPDAEIAGDSVRTYAAEIAGVESRFARRARHAVAELDAMEEL